MKVSVIIPCKGRLDHLKESLPLVLKQTYRDIEVIVVDYNCPDYTGGWVTENHPMVKVAMAYVGPAEWSLSAARNLGFKHCTGDMILFLDADALLEDTHFIQNHVDHCVDGSFICGWGHHDATGCMMIRRTAFEAVNGYNEALKAWGYEDIDIYARLETTLAQEKRVWLGGIQTIKHGDEIRNTFHNGLHPQHTNDMNYEISQTKFKGLYEHKN